MHIKSNPLRSCQILHPLAVNTIQRISFSTNSSFTTFLLFPPKPTFSHFSICCPQMYLFTLGFQVFDQNFVPGIPTYNVSNPLRNGFLWEAFCGRYRGVPLSWKRCCPAAFRVGLSYWVALTAITSFLGHPHLGIKARPFLSYVGHSDGHLELSGSLHFWRPAL